MSGFLRALQAGSRAEAPRARVQEQDLRQWGLTGEWRSSARAGQLVRTRLRGPQGLPPCGGAGRREPLLGAGSVPSPAGRAGRAAPRGTGSSVSPGAAGITFL